MSLMYRAYLVSCVCEAKLAGCRFPFSIQEGVLQKLIIEFFSEYKYVLSEQEFSNKNHKVQYYTEL